MKRASLMLELTELTLITSFALAYFADSIRHSGNPSVDGASRIRFWTSQNDVGKVNCETSV